MGLGVGLELSLMDTSDTFLAVLGLAVASVNKLRARCLSSGNIGGTDFQVVDKDIGVVNCGGHVIRSTHLTIDDEFQVMCSGWQRNDG